MSIVNATLLVETFNPTGNPGEYSFTNAQFLTQYDPNLLGSTVVQPGFVLFVQATDINTGQIIPGEVHKFVITSCSYPTGNSLSGVILWNEPGVEQDAPTNGSYCLLSQATPNLGLGLVPSDEIYPNLPSGLSWGSLLVDLKNIVDLVNYLKTKTASIPFTTPNWVNNGDNTSTLTISHGLDASNLIVCCWKQSSGLLQMVPLYPVTVDSNSFTFTVITSTVFSGQVSVAVAQTP